MTDHCRETKALNDDDAIGVGWYIYLLTFVKLPMAMFGCATILDVDYYISIVGVR